MEDYPVPAWARVPSSDHVWTLVEIKNGMEMANHVLHKSCTLLGRAAEDIELAHDSCSRRHARIAFDSRGVPWLRDLGSTHGTTVNKVPLPAAAIGKVESDSNKAGSRGVVLFPGDVLQFGASTRIFCLEGPREFERGSMKAMQQLKEQLIQRHTEDTRQQPLHDQQDDETESTVKPLDDNTVPPQYQKAWEAVKARQYKLENLETESQRIEIKGELSVGQERQLERNRERIRILQEEIDEMKRDLLNKIYPGKKQDELRSLFSAAAEDDDVDDRTANSRQAEPNQTETEESLIAKWKQSHRDHMIYMKAVSKAERKLVALQEKSKGIGDDEERFFLQNDVDLAKDEYEKAHNNLDEALRDVKETEKLLRIVNKKIVTDLETGYIGTEALVSPDPIMPPPSTAIPPSLSMPPPSRKGPQNSLVTPSSTISEAKGRIMDISSRKQLSPSSNTQSCSTDQSLDPISKRPRIVGPDMPPPLAAVARIKSKSSVPPSGTLSCLTPASSTGNSASQERSKKSSSMLGLDEKKDEWRAPAGQDGSGRTRLNEKFAGRY